jgi:hypothetical protein
MERLVKTTTLVVAVDCDFEPVRLARWLAESLGGELNGSRVQLGNAILSFKMAPGALAHEKTSDDERYLDFLTEVVCEVQHGDNPDETDVLVSELRKQFMNKKIEAFVMSEDVPEGWLYQVIR